MSDLFYFVTKKICQPVFWSTCQATVIGKDNLPKKGGFLLASTHESPYDIPLLMYHSKRHIDFVSTVEVFSNTFAAGFYGRMNAFPLDRNKPDLATVKIILNKLKNKRIVGMFPEGKLPAPGESVLKTGKIQSGIGRLAKIAKVPIVPVAVKNTKAYSSPKAWLPIKKTRHGAAFGEPIMPNQDAKTLENNLVEQFFTLNDKLIKAMEK